MIDRLFVYGSLQSAYDNEYARLLRRNSAFIGKASVRGSIHRLGCFPAFVEGGEGVVSGELYRIEDPEKLLAALDEYEGEDYERALIEVSDAPAWIYALRRNA